MSILDRLRQDLRYAVRSLRRTPGFTITAVLTLALGIGANTAIFGVFDTVLVRPLPYPNADRLYVIHEVIPRPGVTQAMVPVNAFHFETWRAATRSFEDMALLGPENVTLTGSGEPTRMTAIRISPSLFSTLGVKPALGRAFLKEEDVPGDDRVVILGHDLWVTRFGSDPNVIGRAITVDDAPHVVVGVLPPSFKLPTLSYFYQLESGVPADRPQIWKPFAAKPRDLRPLGSFNYVAFARLKPDVSMAQALDDLNAVQTDLAQRAPEKAQFAAVLVPMADQIVRTSRSGLQLVLISVALVLLIACVNITNLLLARGGRRQREFAIRRAAGASRATLVSQTLVESVVLSAIAGSVAVLIGAALVRLLKIYAPIDLPRLDEVTLDVRVLLFTFAVTLASGLLIGILPAWRSTRNAPAELLRSSAPVGASGGSTGHLRSLLVGVEVAVSVICLVSGALLVNSFFNLMSVERGFDIERIVTVDFTLPETRYDTPEASTRFLESLTERVRSLPGVRSAGLTDAVPLSGVSNSAVMIEGSSLPRQERPLAMVRFASPDYFRTLNIALQAGRLIEDADATRRVAVISTVAAERLWPKQEPIGKRFRTGPDDSPLVEVIGVVGNVRGVSLTADPPLNIYLPVVQYFYGRAALAVKTTADPTAVAPAIRRIIRDLDPELAVRSIRTMEDIVEESVAARRFQMNLVLLFAASALFLVGLGIYAVVSQSVIQRTSEIGLRMALGADAGRIRRLVLRQGLLPVALGLAAGIGASLGVAQLLRTLLFEVSPTDIAPLAAASAFLMGVALLASFVPAWRASRLEPMRALRVE